jgi:hypothetical protein
MRFSAILLSTLLIVGCAGEAETDAEMAADAAAMPESGIAGFAGTWQNTVTLVGVADPIPSTMTGTAAGTDWTMSLEGRDPIPLQVSMSCPTLWAAASVKFSGGAWSAQLGSLMGSVSDNGRGTYRLDLGPNGGLYHPRALAFVNQLAIDLGADRHFDQFVLNVTDDPSLWPKLDALRSAHVTLNGAVQQDVWHHDRALDTASLTDAEHGALVFGGLHVTFYVAIHVKPAGELDVAVDPRISPYQCADRRLTA